SPQAITLRLGACALQSLSRFEVELHGLAIPGDVPFEVLLQLALERAHELRVGQLAPAENRHHRAFDGVVLLPADASAGLAGRMPGLNISHGSSCVTTRIDPISDSSVRHRARSRQKWTAFRRRTDDALPDRG